MQIATTVGGCNAQEADLLRRAMGKRGGADREAARAALRGLRRARHHGRDADRIFGAIRPSPTSASPSRTR